MGTARHPGDHPARARKTLQSLEQVPTVSGTFPAGEFLPSLVQLASPFLEFA